MASVFTKIINGEIPCYKVAENEYCLAFLDVNPLAEGHVLVVPKKEVDLLFDLEDQLYHEVNKMVKKLAKALDKAIPCARVGLAVVGLEVPHAHVHLVPINGLGDLDFSKERKVFSPEKYHEIAEKVKSFL